MNPADKRKNTRVPANLEAELKCAGSHTIRGVCKNLSAKGLYFECASPPEENARIELVLHLGDSRYQPSIHVQGKVTRRDEQGAAVILTGIDFKDYEHLKNIIIYSSEDPDAVEQEFKKFLDLYRI